MPRFGLRLSVSLLALLNRNRVTEWYDSYTTVWSEAGTPWWRARSDRRRLLVSLPLPHQERGQQEDALEAEVAAFGAVPFLGGVGAAALAAGSER